MEEERKMYQVYVKLLNGKHKALNFDFPYISALSLKNRIFHITGIPTSEQRLVTGTKHLSDTSFLSPVNGSYDFPILHLLLRLRGGKGGFGSLLRGAANKAGQKKTNNFDACRDMSGRRLRHVNAEKKLEEWKAEEVERRLEKAAEDFLRKKAKAEGKKSKEGGGAETEKYVKKYREDSSKCREVIEKSVRETLGKRKNAAVGGTGGSDAKKLKIWMGKRKVGNSDSDTDDEDSDDGEEEENDKSVVLDNGNHSDSNREAGGSSDSVTGGNLEGSFSGGGSSENSSDGDEITAAGGTSSNGESSGRAMVEEIVEPKVPSSEDSNVSGTEVVTIEKVEFKETESCNLDATVGELPVISCSGEGEVSECVKANMEVKLNPAPVPVVQEETVVMSTDIPDKVEVLNFDEYKSSVELEALGLDRIKSELQLRGLKCGGTLQERAARLFLLKTTPLEKLPKKLFAKK